MAASLLLFAGFPLGVSKFYKTPNHSTHLALYSIDSQPMPNYSDATMLSMEKSDAVCLGSSNWIQVELQSPQFLAIHHVVGIDLKSRSDLVFDLLHAAPLLGSFPPFDRAGP